MVEHNIKIISIDTSCLRIDNNFILLEYAKLMRKMKYLEEFRFCDEDYRDEIMAPIELMVDLPFKSISTDNFRNQKDKIGDIVNVLSRIKTLNEIHVKPDLQTNYLLSAEDFALFKNLPVKVVYLDSFDLTNENMVEFRQVMKEMKIEEIIWFPELEEDQRRLVISIQKFGPDGIYKTI